MEKLNQDAVPDEVAQSEIRILNWNIANPSLERAREQLSWLIARQANVVLLTEVKNSKGGLHLANSLQEVGYKVFFPTDFQGEYCVLLALKGFHSEEWEQQIGYLTERVRTVKVQTFLGEVRLVGLYVPSRGPKQIRNVHKRDFQSKVQRWLTDLPTSERECLIIGGDLNVLEPEHEPRYSVFGQWEYDFYEAFLNAGLVDVYRHFHPAAQEYSWYGRAGSGYRFDHFFIAGPLVPYLTSCEYLHEPRLQKLSDHAAMEVVLKG